MPTIFPQPFDRAGIDFGQLNGTHNKEGPEKMGFKLIFGDQHKE